MQSATLTLPTMAAGAKPSRGSNRNMLIAAGVVLFHLAALWALQAGLLRRVVEVVVPVQMLEAIAPQLPSPEPKPVVPQTPRVPEPVSRPSARQVAPPSAPAPQLPAIAQAEPASNAPTGVLAPSPAAAPLGASDTPRPAPAPEPAKVELPSSNASYLQNPTPVYPAISKRLGEQGKVLVRVLIGADGAPRQAELKRSSGFERLDRAALEYVMKCRYAPGKVAGVPQAMWYEAPVNFVLE